MPFCELDHLAGHDAAQAVDAGDAVADFDDGADFADLELLLEAGDLALQDAGDFRDVDGHVLSDLRFDSVNLRLVAKREAAINIHLLRLESIRAATSCRHSGLHAGVDQLVPHAQDQPADDRVVDVLMHDRILLQRLADVLAAPVKLIRRQFWATSHRLRPCPACSSSSSSYASRSRRVSAGGSSRSARPASEMLTAAEFALEDLLQHRSRRSVSPIADRRGTARNVGVLRQRSPQASSSSPRSSSRLLLLVPASSISASRGMASCVSRAAWHCDSSAGCPCVTSRRVCKLLEALSHQIAADRRR